jgi:uncharacterized protein YabE (DUF348 family)
MPVRPFTDFLREQRAGETEEELARALNELVESVQQTGKAGTLTYTIKVAPVSKETSGQFIVHDDVKLKAPKLSRGATLFFGTPENNLVRTDPRQTALPLMRQVDTSMPTPKAIGGSD